MKLRKFGLAVLGGVLAIAAVTMSPLGISETFAVEMTGVDRYWTGAGNDANNPNNFCTPANWNGGTVPQNGDNLVFDGDFTPNNGNFTALPRNNGCLTSVGSITFTDFESDFDSEDGWAPFDVYSIDLGTVTILGDINPKTNAPDGGAFSAATRNCDGGGQTGRPILRCQFRIAGDLTLGDDISVRNVDLVGKLNLNNKTINLSGSRRVYSNSSTTPGRIVEVPLNIHSVISGAGTLNIETATAAKDYYNSTNNGTTDESFTNSLVRFYAENTYTGTTNINAGYGYIFYHFEYPSIWGQSTINWNTKDDDLLFFIAGDDIDNLKPIKLSFNNTINVNEDAYLSFESDTGNLADVSVIMPNLVLNANLEMTNFTAGPSLVKHEFNFCGIKTNGFDVTYGTWDYDNDELVDNMENVNWLGISSDEGCIDIGTGDGGGEVPEVPDTGFLTRVFGGGKALPIIATLTIASGIVGYAIFRTKFSRKTDKVGKLKK